MRDKIVQEQPVFRQPKLLDLSDPELYLSVLDSLTNLLKSRDQILIDTFRQEVSAVIAREALYYLLIETLSCLAETDFATFLWALHHYDADFYIAFKREMAVVASRRLIEHGLIPGKDFSTLPSGGLMVHQTAQAILLESPSALSLQLFREILHVFD
ncbi:MAG: hypothetical protein KME27_05700 [Lyngbya sp. HA4199-MV5]|jgi:hypothetical protein|nr:hypothetical protein [Lyngbya sp. HA4199-MV5]